MEKIEKFKDCRIENLQLVYGGRRVERTYQAGGGTDKNVHKSSGIKHVSNKHTWFGRDKR